MSVHNIHLRKLLKICSLGEKKLVSELRSDIRQTINNENGISSGGGDFHMPFWADAKSFASDATDLPKLVQARINGNPRRQRLYSLMQEGFLEWWNEKRRWSNEKFEILPVSAKGHYTINSLDAMIKVENLMAVSIGEGANTRLIYPYFAEEPSLNEEQARIGLWVMQKALHNFDIQDMRILDVLRGQAFSVQDSPLHGSEGKALYRKYQYILNRWENLRTEYPKSAA